jgi:hypothetical protein
MENLRSVYRLTVVGTARNSKATGIGPRQGSLIPTRAVGKLLDRYAGEVDALDEETWLSPERGSEVLRQAGFASVSVRTEFFTGSFAHAEEALAWSLAWPLATVRLGRLDRRRREHFFADAREALAGSDRAWSFAFNFYLARRPELR